MAYINGKPTLFSPHINITGGDTTELEEQIADLTAENTELKAQNAELEETVSNLVATNNELMQDVANADAYGEQLEAELEDALAYIEELETQVGGDPAGMYTADGTFSNRVLTWAEMVQRGKYWEQYPPEDWGSGEDRGIWAEGYDVVVPEGNMRVGWFYCNSIVLPETTEVVNGSDSCTLGKVYIKATTPPQLESPAFSEMMWSADEEDLENFAIVVPVGCGDAYRSATGWCEYAEYIIEGEMPI